MRGLMTWLVCVLLACVAQTADYAIESYDVSVKLHADGNMDVTERIQTRFLIPRRGIFRFIPTDLPTGRGTSRRVLLTNIAVSDEQGNRQPILVTREGQNMKIRVGEEDVVYPSGTRKTYVFKYRGFGMLNWFEEDEDWSKRVELYWNATGDQWDVELGRVSVTVDFPAPKPGQSLRARVFAGSYGSRVQHNATEPGNSYSAETRTELTLERGRLHVVRTDPLPAYSGITLVLGLPYELISKPSFGQQAMLFLLPNLGFTLPLLALAAMPILWLRHGRDPHGGPMVVQYEPPDGISGPEAGTLLDEKVDQRDIASGIISLAVNGYLKIHVGEEGLIFKRRTAELEMLHKPAGPELTLFEQELLRELEAAGPMVGEAELRAEVAPNLGDLRKTLYQSMVDRGYYLTDPATARTIWIVGGIGVIVILGVLFTMLSPLHEPFPAIVGGIVAAILVAFFSRGMPRRTKVGAMALQRVRGFEEFIRRARRHEMEWMSKKHPDQVLFEEYLPHAVAFGLTKEWAQAFEGILHEMPSWYVSPYGPGFHPVWFGSDLVTVTNSLGYAASTPPRSSGASGGGSGFSSGGGFSGGGFGGGGGGSW